MAASDSPVPDCVKRNGKIFRTPPHGMDLLSNRSSPRSLEAGMVEPMLQEMVLHSAAMARAEMSEEDGMGSIDPPAFLPPASYYRDPRNHANIATTMLVTARRQVGFEPNLVGLELSREKMEDFLKKYLQWLIELKNYSPYLEMQGSIGMALWFHGGDQNLINQDVSKFLELFRGLEEVVEAWREALKGMGKGASAYVNEHGGTVSTVAFQMDILDTSGNMNPVYLLTFGRTVQSEPPSGNYDSLLTNGTTFLIDSSAIIAAADDFAKHGVPIFGARQYRDYVNNVNH